MAMRVRVISAGSPRPDLRDGRPPPAPLAPSLGWQPHVVLGAPAPGALRVPAGLATPTGMYGPRGVCLHDGGLIVADSGNHRVLIFHQVPTSAGTPVDVVLGQPDAVTDAPNAGGRPDRGMYLPTGVLVTRAGQLVVADAWNHRLLIWHDVPRAVRPPDLILGQSGATQGEPNRGGEAGPAGFYWPFGIAEIAGRFLVADTGNRRVLIWRDGLPSSPETPADVVLGQPDFTAREENRGCGPGPNTFRWPHALAPYRDGFLVADAGNHRLLGWHEQPDQDRPADLVLGQPDMHLADDFPYRPQTATTMRFPYGVVNQGTGVAVADTANNRILLWRDLPAGPDQAADGVLGQRTFAANGENRWEAVTEDTLCWPYGLATDDRHLAVADSGNNRVVIWTRS
jgi:hypothetical protein